MFLTKGCCSEASLISSRGVYFHLLWNDLFIGLVLPVRITLEARDLLLKWSRRGFAFNRWGERTRANLSEAEADVK